MVMVLSSYDFAEISMIAAQEKHPYWRLNSEMEPVVQNGCKEIDRDFKTGEYSLKSEVDDDGNLIITLTGRPTGDPFKTWIMEEVFCIE